MSKKTRNAGKALRFALAYTVLALTARTAISSPFPDASGNENPYASIALRNIFDLHETTGGVNPEQSAKPATGIKLTGITTVLGTRQALLLVDAAEADGKPPGTRSALLAEGQRLGKLEVMQINPEARTVRIRNGEVESLIYLSAAEARK